MSGEFTRSRGNGVSKSAEAGETEEHPRQARAVIARQVALLLSHGCARVARRSARFCKGRAAALGGQARDMLAYAAQAVVTTLSASAPPVVLSRRQPEAVQDARFGGARGSCSCRSDPLNAASSP